MAVLEFDSIDVQGLQHKRRCDCKILSTRELFVHIFTARGEARPCYSIRITERRPRKFLDLGGGESRVEMIGQLTQHTCKAGLKPCRREPIASSNRCRDLGRQSLDLWRDI